MLQFITNSRTVAGTVDQARRAMKGGCTWVQVRMKDAPVEQVEQTVRILVQDCRKTGTTLIVDDHTELALIDGVDGVHLGQNDMAVSEARRILGPNKIIGLTINSMEHAQKAIGAPVNYFGIGPWRYTGTKANLAAILGPEGISRIISYMRSNGMQQTIVAIGGITADDCLQVLTAGADGIAVSGIIAAAASPQAATQQLIEKLRQAEKYIQK